MLSSALLGCRQTPARVLTSELCSLTGGYGVWFRHQRSSESESQLYRNVNRKMIHSCNTSFLNLGCNRLNSKHHVHAPVQRCYFSTQTKLQSSDTVNSNISEYGMRVYKGQISKTVVGVKAFSLSTSVIGLAVQPHLYARMEEIPMFLKLALCGTVSFLVFINPFLIHFIMKSYITDIWYKPDSRIFTARTYSFFLRKQDLQFTADDVVVPEVPGMFSTFRVKGKNLFFDMEQFTDHDALMHMMHYDEPLNLELPEDIKKYYKEKK